MLSQGTTELTYNASAIVKLISEDEGFSSPGEDNRIEVWSTTRIRNFNLRQQEGIQEVLSHLSSS